MRQSQGLVVLFMRLITSYRQFVVDLRQLFVFTLKDDVTSHELRVASLKKENILFKTRNP
jgi:hypothetical protein